MSSDDKNFSRNKDIVGAHGYRLKKSFDWKYLLILPMDAREDVKRERTYLKEGRE